MLYISNVFAHQYFSSGLLGGLHISFTLTTLNPVLRKILICDDRLKPKTCYTPKAVDFFIVYILFYILYMGDSPENFLLPKSIYPTFKIENVNCAKLFSKNIYIFQI